MGNHVRNKIRRWSQARGNPQQKAEGTSRQRDAKGRFVSTGKKRTRSKRSLRADAALARLQAGGKKKKARRNPGKKATWLVWEMTRGYEAVYGCEGKWEAEALAVSRDLEDEDLGLSEAVQHTPEGVKVAGRYLQIGEVGYMPHDTAFPEMIKPMPE